MAKKYHFVVVYNNDKYGRIVIPHEVSGDTNLLFLHKPTYYTIKEEKVEFEPEIVAIFETRKEQIEVFNQWCEDFEKNGTSAMEVIFNG